MTDPEVRRYFMTIPEAVHLVIQAGGMPAGGELLVLNMGEQVRIVDLAQDLIKLSGFSPEEITVALTGLRPGEKLQEALWEADAVVEATSHPEIMRVSEREPVTPVDLAAPLGTLEAAVRRSDRAEIKELLAKCVPTFAPPLVAGIPPRRAGPAPLAFDANAAPASRQPVHWANALCRTRSAYSPDHRSPANDGRVGGQCVSRQGPRSTGLSQHVSGVTSADVAGTARYAC